MLFFVLLELQNAFFQDVNYQDDEYFNVPNSEDDPVEFLRAKMRARAKNSVLNGSMRMVTSRHATCK